MRKIPNGEIWHIEGFAVTSDTYIYRLWYIDGAEIFPNMEIWYRIYGSASESTIWYYIYSIDSVAMADEMCEVICDVCAALRSLIHNRMPRALLVSCVVYIYECGKTDSIPDIGKEKKFHIRFTFEFLNKNNIFFLKNANLTPCILFLSI